MENAHVVRTKNITFRYGAETILENITLDIRRGEFLGVIGPNGSGKTTLLKIILGLLKPSEGQVFLFDKEIGRFTDWDKVGYVPQKAGALPIFFPITVAEVVSLASRSPEAAVKALAAVDMQEHANRLITRLSGGQQQRVFIARALASEPELLVLDEPTVGVDTDSQASFYELLRHLNRERKLTIVLISHDVDVVAHEVGTIACINRGLVCHGKPKELIKGDFMEELYGKHLRFVVHGH
jgi:zinc transport system ATP-binding protein